MTRKPGLIILFCLLIFYGPAYAQVRCDNWVYLPSMPSYIDAGEHDITGDKITVEAMIIRTAPWTGSQLFAGDIVSKHEDFQDCNYLLRPNTAEITTTNGYFRTPDICPIRLHKAYHVAFVYDGSTLKFYRNGFLMSQVPASGNLFQNNWRTQIGIYFNKITNTQFIGFINEVRIWNVARTQAEIRANMNTSLPNPATQTGLRAYYTFNNLLNKQGNAAWNGALGGAASINQSPTACVNFVADSCDIPNSPPIGGVINEYTEVLALDVCENILRVRDASRFNVGDTVLMIQMKGAVIDSTNTSAFGTVTNYRNAGNYEYNYISQKTGNSLVLRNKLVRSYDIPDGSVQLVRVPYYQNVSVTSALTAAPWNGSTGGVLAMNVAGKIELLNDISVTGRGFRGGSGRNISMLITNCFTNNYFYPAADITAAGKGESIAYITSNISSGKGAVASGGGGGLDHNSGGGGGSNGGVGGFGGYQLEPCGNSPFDNRGIGGAGLLYNNAANKIFLGGGAGGGHVNNPGNPPMDGGNGGGMIIIKANELVTNGYRIVANGTGGPTCVVGGSRDCHEGMGGGGGGGTILLDIPQITGATIIETLGGKGADMTGSVSLGGRIGPGGGGGGGVLWLSNASLPGNVTNISLGGARGVLIQDANNPWGATAGTNGTTLFNLAIPFASVPFKKNIDSVRIDTTIDCGNVLFNGLAYTNGGAIAGWSWNFGDGNLANTQNTSHSYGNPGTYTVKLIATDIAGCRDSFSISVTVAGYPFDFEYRQDACNPLMVSFFGRSTPLNAPYWSFGDGATVTGNTMPTHTYAATGIYEVKFHIQDGCPDTLVKFIPVEVIPDNIILTPDTTICADGTAQLRTLSSGNFCWFPHTYLDDPLSPNPVTSSPIDITYYFTSEIKGVNLVVNGDFNNGNTGFTSQYQYNTSGLAPGVFFVGTNPVAWHPGMTPCSDHTTGNGQMLLVNGTEQQNIRVWTQTVTVQPNTNYAFSTWLQHITTVNPASLQFSINGKLLGNIFQANNTTCTWNRFDAVWNSGTNTSATISIVNMNQLFTGNDFALDDIFFGSFSVRRDSVRISVDRPVVVTGNDTTICSGTELQLSASGASTWSWSPATGLSASNIANPVATPVNAMEYVVTGTTVNGCIADDTIVINTHPLPVITKTADTTICLETSVQLNVTGGSTYTWTPSAGLNNATIGNPVATPLANTVFHVLITDMYNCSFADSIKVDLQPIPIFTASPDTSICEGARASLFATGGDIYSWTPAASLSDAVAPDPVATPLGTTQYTVHITESQCLYDTTINIVITVNPNPVVTAQKSNDIDCAIPYSQLTANGTNTYLWTPAESLDHPDRYNPIAFTDSNTYFVVTGTNQYGCFAKDSVLIKVTTDNVPVYAVPNAFTPNNDGWNDCFGIKKWGTTTLIEFSVYNRWGQKVFTTKNPTQCWDGTVNGKPQDTGGYAYVIRARTICGEVKRTGTVLLIR